MLRSVFSLAFKQHILKVQVTATCCSSQTANNILPTCAASGRPFQITSLDHLVLTVRDLEKTVEFYTNVLGMEATTFRGGRKALNFGVQKINLHELGKEFEPKSQLPTPGSADLCFLTPSLLDDVMAHLKKCDINIVEGPVERTGAVGGIRSIYVRDPDGNLIEISNYINRVDRI
ncbi:Glyoxalase domain-containing protein 5 [Bulinus truncatus]|nr:Glyoxalase domain-containing protein 5 [Bulinus truncatus]